MRVHLVDGTYELFRNHFGAPPATAPDGRQVGAVRGLLRTLWSLLREPDTTHVAIAFDTRIESFRNDLFAGYKTGSGIDPDLWAQFPVAERAAEALGLPTWRMLEFETDDALATAAVQCAADARVGQVVLCTTDKDLAQCVRGERVVMLDRRKRIVLDESGVRAKFGVPPQSIPDWLALVGDDADGIPGIDGFGAKGAAAVLAAFGHLEAVPQDPAAWPREVRGAARLAAALQAAWSDALLYRTLATLRTDVSIDAAPDALRWLGVFPERLHSLCAELGFESFADTVRAAGVPVRAH